MEHFVNLLTTIPTLLFVVGNRMRALSHLNEEHKEAMEFLQTIKYEELEKCVFIVSNK